MDELLTDRPPAAAAETASGPAVAAGARLSGCRVVAAVPVPGGTNNRLYRLETTGGRFALKHYAARDGDPRDRLGAETAALALLGRALPGAVPAVVAVDRAGGWALHEWIDGVPAEPCGAGDIDAALALVARLRDLSRSGAGADLPPASEACPSLAELLGQIERRRRRLDEVAPAEPALAAFLEAGFGPLCRQAAAAAQAVYAAAGLDAAAALERERQILSPSDFGFHNSRRRPDGRLVFLDFEYFGWDDPVKLTADFAVHPGMAPPPALRRRFRQGMAGLCADDPGFAARLAAFEPLIGVRWCLTLLNEFLPERWRRRRHAGAPADWAAAKARQLAKAEALCRAVAHRLGGGTTEDGTTEGETP